MWFVIKRTVQYLLLQKYHRIPIIWNFSFSPVSRYGMLTLSCTLRDYQLHIFCCQMTRCRRGTKDRHSSTLSSRKVLRQSLHCRNLCPPLLQHRSVCLCLFCFWYIQWESEPRSVWIEWLSHSQYEYYIDLKSLLNYSVFFGQSVETLIVRSFTPSHHHAGGVCVSDQGLHWQTDHLNHLARLHRRGESDQGDVIDKWRFPALV